MSFNVMLLISFNETKMKLDTFAGDIAILLHSGMSMRRALFLNFLSACVCFIGLVLGIVLGENTEANRWILAVAGGLFLYVPLVDMVRDTDTDREYTDG